MRFNFTLGGLVRGCNKRPQRRNLELEKKLPVPFRCKR